MAGHEWSLYRSGIKLHRRGEVRRRHSPPLNSFSVRPRTQSSPARRRVDAKYGHGRPRSISWTVRLVDFPSGRSLYRLRWHRWLRASAQGQGDRNPNRHPHLPRHTGIRPIEHHAAGRRRRPDQGARPGGDGSRVPRCGCNPGARRSRYWCDIGRRSLDACGDREHHWRRAARRRAGAVGPCGPHPDRCSSPGISLQASTRRIRRTRRVFRLAPIFDRDTPRDQACTASPIKSLHSAPPDSPPQRAWQRFCRIGRGRVAGPQAFPAAAQGCATPLSARSVVERRGSIQW